MSTFIDTNVFLRYLIGTPEELAKRAASLIDGQQPLIVTDVVLVESAHVLRTHYGLPRGEIVDALQALVQKVNISVHNIEREVVVDALTLCRSSGRVNFGDALIWAVAKSTRDAQIYSFDRRFPKDGIQVRQP